MPPAIHGVGNKDRPAMAQQAIPGKAICRKSHSMARQQRKRQAVNSRQ